MGNEKREQKRSVEHRDNDLGDSLRRYRERREGYDRLRSERTAPSAYRAQRNTRREYRV